MSLYEKEIKKFIIFMELQEFLKLLKTKWEWVLFIVTIISGTVFLLNIFQIPEYSSTARIMIIQRSLQDSDAFIAARSSERLSIILSEVIYSNSFFNDVLKASPGITDDFGSEPAERRKGWKRQVKNRIDSDKGILDIAVYDKNKVQSTEILNGILKMLTENGEKYHGGGSNIQIRVIDEPLVSKDPARPNTIMNTVLAAILALVGTSVFIYLFSEQQPEYKHDRSRFGIPPIGV